jgi:hypothetical protein
MDAIAQKELDDLVLLDEINEENVVAGLKTRYQNGSIYTYIGARDARRGTAARGSASHPGACRGGTATR